LKVLRTGVFRSDRRNPPRKRGRPVHLRPAVRVAVCGICDSSSVLSLRRKTESSVPERRRRHLRHDDWSAEARQRLPVGDPGGCRYSHANVMKRATSHSPITGILLIWTFPASR
jgi:hypothetical protein